MKKTNGLDAGLKASSTTVCPVQGDRSGKHQALVCGMGSAKE